MMHINQRKPDVLYAKWEKNKSYIEGFGYVAPAKTKTIIVDLDGDINKMVGAME